MAHLEIFPTPAQQQLEHHTVNKICLARLGRWSAVRVVADPKGSPPVGDGWRHPYAEAVGAGRRNGRPAWIILGRAAFEHCRRGVAAGLTADRPACFKALRAADTGDLNPLVERLRTALTQGGEA